jgi:hypothetical protein
MCRLTAAAASAVEVTVAAMVAAMVARAEEPASADGSVAVAVV